MDSLESEESRATTVPANMPLVDINSASVFTLMSVRGINQELAANIVDHRERRGPYLNFDDLLKVFYHLPLVLLSMINDFFIYKY